MKILLGVLHLLVSFSLLGVVLSQHRKEGGFTGAFGAGGAQLDKSSTWQRMTPVTKITWGLLVAFIILSILQVVAR
ncbi:MAG: preprotein translocase subunit SecG [Synergistaceae bacterium]|nr:preprotein translocase subunit SecG [Synergistaceae bacterium]